MSAAIDMHDRLLRQYMAQFFGYEVQTEGDAFLVAFHEPFDAVAWCLTTQLALNSECRLLRPVACIPTNPQTNRASLPLLCPCSFCPVPAPAIPNDFIHVVL